MSQGYLLLQLHAHLPFIRHPENDDFLEEDWLFEAMTETYIPILNHLQKLLDEKVYTRLTMTWSPPLCEMIADPLLQKRYKVHTKRLLGLAEQEVEAKENTPFSEAALMYRDHYKFCLETMEKYDDNLLAWVKELMEAGILEPITCGATHGYLPLMQTIESKRAQIQIAKSNYNKHFGRDPKGIWLPECGFIPGVDELLKEAGINFFFVESHGIYYAEPKPAYGVYAPLYTPSGVAAFGRDQESSRSVWAAEVGYPGHPAYREFYRDLGYDGDYNYVKSTLHDDGVRRNIGLKFHKITGKVDLNDKLPYIPTDAFGQAMEHAGDFVYNRGEQIKELNNKLGTKPVVVAPYDAELFGHWWFEGPQFISSIFHTAEQNHDLRVVTGSEYLELENKHQIAMPAASSWGEGGYNKVWLNEGNDWIYPHLHMLETRMVEVANRFKYAEGDLRRALNQMAREVLLAQSSDWAFIMTTGTTIPYAERRTKDHINRFTCLYEQILSNTLDLKTLSTIEWYDTIFQEIDFRHYCT